MSRCLAILIVCALTSCATVQPAAEHSEAEVREASDQFWATRDRGDASAFTAQFTDDGIFMVPGLADATGRDAILKLAEKRFAAVRPTDFTIHRREIDVAGDSAHELAWFSETIRGPHESTRMSGRYLLVW
ncbi:MAG TPA: SgcJ/EcaC family oxidoreductase, partial [Thermoanaerobaculia bacterium]|nr:SgcJ/EcaC family oxidoreductase [Thermoanaerobaculia bacterium]